MKAAPASRHRVDSLHTSPYATRPARRRRRGPAIRRHADRHPAQNGRLATQLAGPLFGYVERPLLTRNYRSDADTSITDLILVSMPAMDRTETLRELARRSRWRLADRAEDGPVSMEASLSPRADTGRGRGPGS